VPAAGQAKNACTMIESAVTYTTSSSDPDPSLRNLPPGGWSRALTLVGRALRRRCPQCGGKGIFRNWFSLRDSCPRCGYAFDREEGYFLGGYALNLIFAEFIGLAIVIYILVSTDLSLLAQELIAVGTMIAIPIILFPYSRTLWMALDLQIHRDITEKQLRADQMIESQRSRT